MAHYSGENIEIDGLDELIEAFGRLPDEANVFLMKGANEAGGVVLEKAKAKVPVLSGNLKSKLKLGAAKISSKYPFRVFAKITAPGAGYMVPLELGHKMVLFKRVTDRRVEEKPFLRPAADESKQEVADILTKYLNEALEQMGGKK